MIKMFVPSVMNKRNLFLINIVNFNGKNKGDDNNE